MTHRPAPPPPDPRNAAPPPGGDATPPARRTPPKTAHGGAGRLLSRLLGGFVDGLGFAAGAVTLLAVLRLVLGPTP